ncbi:hypothetical protein LC593_06350 [Nostoc sp. CHAB 5844]|nr:hypothetical protein [Nostoc sp. CHAB 5844]
MLGSQRRGVSVAIFDVGASAVRWGDSTVVRQRGLGGFPYERLPKGSATPVATTLGTPLRVTLKSVEDRCANAVP